MARRLDLRCFVGESRRFRRSAEAARRGAARPVLGRATEGMRAFRSCRDQLQQAATPLRGNAAETLSQSNLSHGDYATTYDGVFRQKPPDAAKCWPLSQQCRAALRVAYPLHCGLPTHCTGPTSSSAAPEWESNPRALQPTQRDDAAAARAAARNPSPESTARQCSGTRGKPPIYTGLPCVLKLFCQRPGEWGHPASSAGRGSASSSSRNDFCCRAATASGSRG